MGKEYGPAHTTQQERFGGFALAHLGLSCLSFPLFWLGLFQMDLPGAVIFVGASLLAYFPLGVLAAWMGSWTIPLTGRERWQAVAYPTAVAWVWVGFVLLSLATAAGELLILAFFVSLMLAAPSSALVLLTMPLWGSGSSWGGLVPVGLLAGVLPPLLFAWGSFCQAEWAQMRTIKKRRAALPGA